LGGLVVQVAVVQSQTPQLPAPVAVVEVPKVVPLVLAAQVVVVRAQTTIQQEAQA